LTSSLFFSKVFKGSGRTFECLGDNSQDEKGNADDTDLADFFHLVFFRVVEVYYM